MMTVIASDNEEIANRWNRNRCEYLREVLWFPWRFFVVVLL
jgi:hypothetical protein